MGMSAIKRASEIVGSQQKLAELLGVTSGAVSQWVDGEVPVQHCIPIEKITSGAVRCEDLNRHHDWAYLRATDCDVATVKDSLTAQKLGAGKTVKKLKKAA